MTFDEFLAECGSARSVLTTDGTSLLIGDYVIECRGLDSSITSYIADALRMIPTEPETPVEPEIPGETANELVARIDTMFRAMMAELKPPVEAPVDEPPVEPQARATDA